MKWFSPSFRLAVGVTSTVFSVLFLLTALGLVADPRSVVIDRRAAICEQLAIHSSLLICKQQSELLEPFVKAVCQRDEDILSSAIRKSNGTLILEIGDHLANWTQTENRKSTADQVQIPIMQGDQVWGTVELRFRELSMSGLMAYYFHLIPPYISLTGLIVFIFTYVYLSRCMKTQNGNHSSDIPERVRATLDTLVEGVLVLDKNQKVALANKSFAKTVDKSIEDLEGRNVKKISWIPGTSNSKTDDLPWASSVKTGAPETGVVLGVKSQKGESISLSVNTTPITDDDGVCRGALATFDDISHSEKKNKELKQAIQRLDESRAKIHKQNKLLANLASHDPLTDFLNRRTFFEQFSVQWNISCRNDQPLSCIMIDIDHFKSVNDTHGHQTGDDVLRDVALALKSTLRGTDIICRYGGEEFCIILPLMDIEGAMIAAERFRRSIDSLKFSNMKITISLGVSSLRFGAMDSNELVEQSDMALYASKRRGRNCVTRWDRIEDNNLVSETPATAPEHVESTHTEPEQDISRAVVASLMTALAHRDSATAAHSRRVSDYCMAVAKDLISTEKCTILETAALLHDIGKLGVPDSILLKPGPLTDKEWEIMKTHDEMGVDIVASACHSEPLIDVIKNHHAWYAGNPRNPDLPCGQSIPFNARILAIADAYDAMTTDRVYRKARRQDVAFAELRNCSPRQFDPELVEKFIGSISDVDDNSEEATGDLQQQQILDVGLQLEKIAQAHEEQDTATLSDAASCLGTTAVKNGMIPIAEMAALLRQTANSANDPLKMAELSADLLELCSETQRTYIEGIEEELIEI